MSTAAVVSIEPASRVARGEAIIFTELDGVVVMMDAEEGSYYELNPVGARIWALAESRPRVAEICAAFVAEYEVAPDRCADEVRAFLEELRRREVMRVLPRNGANGIGNDAARDPEAPSISRDAAAPRDRHEPGTRLAWITPTIRVLAIKRTAAGTGPEHEFEEHWGYPNYTQES